MIVVCVLPMSIFYLFMRVDCMTLQRLTILCLIMLCGVKKIINFAL